MGVSRQDDTPTSVLDSRPTVGTTKHSRITGHHRRRGRFELTCEAALTVKVRGGVVDSVMLHLVQCVERRVRGQTKMQIKEHDRKKRWKPFPEV